MVEAGRTENILPRRKKVSALPERQRFVCDVRSVQLIVYRWLHAGNMKKEELSEKF